MHLYFIQIIIYKYMHPGNTIYLHHSDIKSKEVTHSLCEFMQIIWTWTAGQKNVISAEFLVQFPSYPTQAQNVFSCQTNLSTICGVVYIFWKLEMLVLLVSLVYWTPTEDRFLDFVTSVKCFQFSNRFLMT